MPAHPRHSQGIAAINAVTALLVTMLVLQVWLLSATLDTFLAGHKEPVLPAAIVSGVLCGICFVLYRFVRRVDRAARRAR